MRPTSVELLVLGFTTVRSRVVSRCFQPDDVRSDDVGSYKIHAITTCGQASASSLSSGLSDPFERPR